MKLYYMYIKRKDIKNISIHDVNKSNDNKIDYDGHEDDNNNNNNNYSNNYNYI